MPTAKHYEEFLGRTPPLPPDVNPIFPNPDCVPLPLRFLASRLFVEATVQFSFSPQALFFPAAWGFPQVHPAPPRHAYSQFPLLLIAVTFDYPNSPYRDSVSTLSFVFLIFVPGLPFRAPIVFSLCLTSGDSPLSIPPIDFPPDQRESFGHRQRKRVSFPRYLPLWNAMRLFIRTRPRKPLKTELAQFTYLSVFSPLFEPFLRFFGSGPPIRTSCSSLPYPFSTIFDTIRLAEIR